MPDAGWREIADENGIHELMDLFGRFHDGCIREMHVATGHSVGPNLSMLCDWPTTVHMLIQRQRRDPSAIELRFEEVSAFKLNPPPPGYVSIIFECLFVLQEGVFYWSEDARFAPGSPEASDSMWLAARRVWWRDASDWMGATLRYRVER